MKRFVSYGIAIVGILFSACSSGSGIRGYWDGVDIKVSETNYQESEDRFAQFAELAVKAPQEDAVAAMDVLFEKLASDEVSYYIYEEWMESAFYSLLSPCHSPTLFEAAASRVEADGIVVDRMSLVSALRHYNSLNLKGQKCSLPALSAADGTPVEVPGGQPCTVLVVDTGCNSCREALASSLKDGDGRHVAVCLGGGVPPAIEGWEYCSAPDADEYFDSSAAPFWFGLAADGTVTQGYTMPAVQ